MTTLPYIHSYDIRGIYSKHFSREVIQDLAKGIVSEFLPKKVIIGYDMRESSPEFFDILSAQCSELGVEVISIGLASTPQLYFATCIHDCDLGIIITASHNPKEYNGMKVCRKNAFPIAYDTGLNAVERRIVEQDFISNVQENNSNESLRGSIQEISVIKEYDSTILSYLSKINDKPKQRPIKIAIDYANAIGCFSNKPVLEQLEKDGFIECVHVFDELDGTFPNHEANPIKEENLEYLKEVVVKEECDFGVSFDGDSDRVGFVDEKGRYVAPDVMGCFLVNHLNKHDEEFETFCYDLRSTRNLTKLGDDIKKNYFQTRVGHSHIKKKMHEVDAQFACELSGHFYFEESGSKYDDALRALVESICAFSYYDESLSKVVEKFNPKLKSPEINFTVRDANQEMEDSKDWFIELIDTSKEELVISHLDGVLIEHDTFWVNIRKSNTEPLLRVNYEVINEDKKLFDTITKIITNKLN
ncbi:MAG: phosphomannomutase/phosphoglucomutase [Candidatus Woesearchaeota archaeon]